MSKSVVESGRVGRAAAALLLLAAIGSAQPGIALEEASRPAGASAQFELTRGVKQSLARLQEHWLQWNAAFVQDNSARGVEATRQILATARQVGFTRVEDLSRGAAARAIESAAGGNWPRARWALESAEALDPDQPTVAVAGLLAAWKAGRFRELIGYSFDVLRRLNAPATRELFLAELHLWWLLFWWVLGAAWVVGSVAVWGSALLEDLRALLLPGLPLGVSRTVLVLFLGLPLLFPGGAAWLLLWLSIWLWPYHDRWGKGAIALFWLATALVPSATDGIRERVDFALQPAVRAIQAFSENRLYGGFLSDLLVLRAALPQEPRALELFADVHRTMGQWELARDFYNRVLEREPSNFYALLNLGGYYFRKGDFGKAITFYRKAAEAVPSSAAAQFNLSTTYSENYLFDEARAALERARKLDAASVDAWIRTPPPERVVVYNGSLVRKEELKSVLASNRQMAGKGTTSWRDLLPRVVPAVVSVVAALLTMGVSFWWRVRESSRPSVRWEATPNRWIERFLPPIAQLASGSSLVAFAQLTLLVALALLPLLFGMMVGLPWGGYRPRAILVGLVTLALVVSLALRQALRSREA